MRGVAHGNQGQDRTEIARMQNSKFEKIYCLTGAASYSKDRKSTGEFDITRGLRSESVCVCVRVCVMVIRGCIPEMRTCKQEAERKQQLRQ